MKDALEIESIRHAASVTAAGFAALRDVLRPGVTERALQIELEAAFFRAGATRTGYGTIVGSGPNSAILHVEPSARVVHEGEFVLIDGGGAIDRYTADVTRTYVAGKASTFQCDLYNVVLSAQTRAIARCVPGAEWKEIHLATAVDLVAGLVAMGVMRGAPETLRQAIDQGNHLVAARHGKSAAGTEVILDIDHQEKVAVTDPPELSHGSAPDRRVGGRPRW